MIGQFGDNWKELYSHQINLIVNSNLYQHTQFIDVYAIGKENLPFILDKFNNITYLGYQEEEIPSNKKLYRGDKTIFKNIWSFSKLYQDYKILFYHALGVSSPKNQWRDYLEKINIEYWKECIDLLDYYDCVGTELVPLASYKNHTIEFLSPHFQGGIWWANSKYLEKLDPFYFHQPVEIQQFLGELWIGTGNPKAYSFYNTGLLKHLSTTDLTIPYTDILYNARVHLKDLKLSPWLMLRQ